MQLLVMDELQEADMAKRPNLFRPQKERTWREIAEELRTEEDQERMLELVKELNDLMVEEERQKVKKRIERNAPTKPSRSSDPW